MKWFRMLSRALWALLNCLFGVWVGAVALPLPYGGLLLTVVGGYALAYRTNKVWLTFFVLEGIGAQFFAIAWFLAGLVLCTKYFV